MGQMTTKINVLRKHNYEKKSNTGLRSHWPEAFSLSLVARSWCSKNSTTSIMSFQVGTGLSLVSHFFSIAVMHAEGVESGLDWISSRVLSARSRYRPTSRHCSQRTPISLDSTSGCGLCSRGSGRLASFGDCDEGRGEVVE